MNQGKVWRVVNPSVGVPLFLTAVVIGSVVVHGALMIKTDWFGAYWNGNQKAKAVSMAPAETAVAAAPTTAPK
jgi:light-harvesting protein B-800-850 alpha chain